MSGSELPRVIVYHLLQGPRPLRWVLLHGPWTEAIQRRLWTELSPRSGFEAFFAKAEEWDAAGRPPIDEITGEWR